MYWNFHDIHQNTDPFRSKKDLNLTLFTSTMKSIINSISRENSIGIDSHFHKIVSMKMIESIVISLKFHIAILSAEENPEVFLQLFKQIDVSDPDLIDFTHQECKKFYPYFLITDL